MSETTSSTDNQRHVQFGDSSVIEDGKERVSKDQERWDINEIGDDLATELRLFKKYGSPLEFRGLEPITEPMERKEFRKEYVSGVVNKHKKLVKRKAKKTEEDVDIPGLLQRFASKHAQNSAAHARVTAASDEKDAAKIFQDSMDEMVDFLG